MFTSFNARALGLKLSARETLRLAEKYGFGGVDVMIRDAMDENVDFPALTREMDDLGLRPGAFPLPFEWRTTDDSRFAEDLRNLQLWAKAASILGLTRTATWVMPETAEFADATEQNAAWMRTFAFHVDRLHQVAKVLNEFDIRLGLEVIGVESSRTARGQPFICRLDQIETLRGEIESRASVPVGVLVDSWHLYAAEEPISHAFSWEIDKIVWVHVADLPLGASSDPKLMIDAVRGLPREHGETKSHELLAELKKRGYQGPVIAEPLARCSSILGLPPDRVADLAARSLSSIWPH